MKRATPKSSVDPFDIPNFLRIPPDRRASAWAGVPMTQVDFTPRQTRDEDAATVAFRAQVEEERRQKALARIAKMKVRQTAKSAPIDHSRMRWDPRKCKFVEDAMAVVRLDKSAMVTQGRPLTGPKNSPEFIAKMNKEYDTVASRDNERDRGVYHLPSHPRERQSFAQPASKGGKTQALVDGLDWSLINKDNAEALARRNGVWEDKYAKLSNGLKVMTVTNRLKGLVKKGQSVCLDK